MENNQKQILKVIVGSQAHGLATPESDYDYRGVFVVPTSELLRLGGTTKTTSWIEGKDDDTQWELGHFLNLATHCNPTILETFLAPQLSENVKVINKDTVRVKFSKYGEELQALFPHIWNSVDVYNAFRGYSKNQQKKFLDKKDAHPHKFASAYLRVLYQAIELLNTGTFPVDFRKTPIYDSLVRWKNKDYTIGEVMTLTAVWENELDTAFENNPNKQADLEPVNEFLLKVRKENW